MIPSETLIRLMARPRGLKPSRASLHVFAGEGDWADRLLGALSFEHFSRGAFQLYLHEETPLSDRTKERISRIVTGVTIVQGGDVFAVSEKNCAIIWNTAAACVARPSAILSAIDEAKETVGFLGSDRKDACVFLHDREDPHAPRVCETETACGQTVSRASLLARMLPRNAAKLVLESDIATRSRKAARGAALEVIKAAFFRIPAWVPSRKVAGKPSEISVHLLIGVRSYREAPVTLRSWERFTGRPWNVFLHDDGTLTPEHFRHLEKYCSGYRVISRAESDKAVLDGLAAHPECRKLRTKLPHSLKFFDFRHYAPGERYFVLDADVLFFAEPRELLRLMDDREPGCWFNAESPESYCLTRRALEDFLGKELWRGVNSGVAIVEKKAMSLGFIEKFLAHFDQRWDCSGLAEQTSFALCASEHGVGGFLPKEYEISFQQWKSPGAVMRHYAAHTKFDMMYVEGVVTLLPRLLKT